MAKKKPPKTTLRDVTDAEIDTAIGEALSAANSPPDMARMHDLFNQQLRTMLDDAGLNEEEKQAALVAMSCPCCGGGAASFTYKLKPKGQGS